MNRPIGVFDSGVGGLTVVKALREVLPQEDLIYFGDTARVPYGSKSRQTVTEFSLEISRFLCAQGIKMLLIACNTASAVSLPFLMKKLSLPVLGVIHPGAAAAVKVSRTLRIGVVGTSGTIRSQAYQKALRSLDPQLKTIAEPCPLLVPLVEEGWWNGSVALSVTRHYLKPLKEGEVDTLILGCTHYPLIRPLFLRVLGKQVHLVDPGREAALRARELLERRNLLSRSFRKGETLFFSSDDPEHFKQMGMRFLGRPIREVKLKRF